MYVLFIFTLMEEVGQKTIQKDVYLGGSPVGPVDDSSQNVCARQNKVLRSICLTVSHLHNPSFILITCSISYSLPNLAVGEISNLGYLRGIL
jgi:hypothetical protein